MRPRPTHPNRWTTGRTDAWRDRSLLIAASLAALLAVPALAAETPQRYTVEAELRPLALSADGRFGLDATARYTAQAKSADGRFVLKAVNVPEGGCEAFADPVFANGFESP
jgi:hypothetical protein